MRFLPLLAKTKIGRAEWSAGSPYVNPFTPRVSLESIACHFYIFEIKSGNKAKDHTIFEAELLFGF